MSPGAAAPVTECSERERTLARASRETEGERERERERERALTELEHLVQGTRRNSDVSNGFVMRERIPVHKRYEHGADVGSLQVLEQVFVCCSATAWCGRVVEQCSVEVRRAASLAMWSGGKGRKEEKGGAKGLLCEHANSSWWHLPVKGQQMNLVPLWHQTIFDLRNRKLRRSFQH